MSIWCFFDVAGRYWVELKKYQKSLKDREAAVIAQTDYRNATANMLSPQLFPVQEDGGRRKIKVPFKRSGVNPNRSWRHR